MRRLSCRGAAFSAPVLARHGSGFLGLGGLFKKGGDAAAATTAPPATAAAAAGAAKPKGAAVATEEELPELFARQPVEVDDYIRPDRTVFERLEDTWDWLLTFASPVDKQVGWMRAVHNNGFFGVFPDLSWGGVFVVYGFAMRLTMLIPALYAHRNTLRLQQIQTPLAELNGKTNAIKNDRTMTSSEKRIVREGVNRMRKALYKQHGCSQGRTAAQMVAMPLTVSAFLAVQRLCSYEPDLERQPFLWVSDLTMPDPTMMLPVVCASMFLFNYELSQRMQRGGRSALGLYVRYAARFGCVAFAYGCSGQPSALFAYWIGLSLAGVLQPLLLRWQPFRDFFNFPDPPAAAHVKIIGKRGADGEREPLLQSLKFALFASKQEKAAKKEAARAASAAEHKEATQRALYTTIDQYEVVFDDAATAPTNKKK